MSFPPTYTVFIDTRWNSFILDLYSPYLRPQVNQYGTTIGERSQRKISVGSGRGFNDLQRLDRRIREPLFAAETKWMRVVEDASLLLLLHLEQHAANPLRILLVVLSPRAPCWAARFWYKRQQFIEGLGCFFPFGNILFQLVKEFASHVQSIENVP